MIADHWLSGAGRGQGDCLQKDKKELFVIMEVFYIMHVVVVTTVYICQNS